MTASAPHLHRLRPLLSTTALLAAASIVVACGDGSTAGFTNAPPVEPAPDPIDLETPDADRCEILLPGECLLPFPSDALTTSDPSTDTGRRVRFAREAMPQNVAGVHVDPTEWNRNDGFSPGAQIMVLLPGLDPAASGLAPVTDLARSLDEDSSLVLLDAETGERVLAWAEVDSHADDAARRALLIHPATNLREGHRHVVALRNLVDGDGNALAGSDVFAAFRDDVATTNPAIEDRRPAMERVFADLETHGIDRSELDLAWDFTVASARNLSERLLHMRDDAFLALGDAAPTFTVESVADGGATRSVMGTFEVPRYLTGDGSPGAVLNNAGDDPKPRRNGTQTANFICVVPAAPELVSSGRSFLYGHGLLGSAAEVLGIGQLGASIGVTSCASDWIGMSAADIPNAIEILGDLSTFRSFPDRLQQGHLNFLFLGRLMIHPDGFGSHPAFQVEGRSVLSDELAFLGASQGGIVGGATAAVAQDFTRAVMAVGAANYSLLIPRSVDFDEFDPLFAESYPDPFDRRLGFGLAQMLWDRGEANGYLHHLTRDPYADTPPKEILYFMAFGDHQVANVATEVAARTIGASNREPALRPGRSTSVEPFFGLEPIESFPFDGSALVTWDFGSPAPPDENLPPRAGEDPHGKASEVVEVLVLVTEFLRADGAVIDVCGGEPCTTLE